MDYKKKFLNRHSRQPSPMISINDNFNNNETEMEMLTYDRPLHRCATKVNDEIHYMHTHTSHY